MKYLLEGVETPRIYFRKIDTADFNDWLSFFKEPKAFKHWKREPEAPETECKFWYEKQFGRYQNDQGGMNALVEKATGKLIGHCGLLVQKVDDVTELEIGYSLLPPFWNNGFATEAAMKSRDHAFEHNFSDSLISIVALTNTPSANVAIKNGMQSEKQTNYNQNAVTIYRITRGDWQTKNGHQKSP